MPAVIALKNIPETLQRPAPRAGTSVVTDQPYANTQALVDSFSATYSRNARAWLASAEARASGTRITPGQMHVKAAFGVAHRLEETRYSDGFGYDPSVSRTC